MLVPKFSVLMNGHIGKDGPVRNITSLSYFTTIPLCRLFTGVKDCETAKMLLLQLACDSYAKAGVVAHKLHLQTLIPATKEQNLPSVLLATALVGTRSYHLIKILLCTVAQPLMCLCNLKLSLRRCLTSRAAETRLSSPLNVQTRTRCSANGPNRQS
ncbi:hypothetical protein BDY19DRAFT_605523 [Irpex rosettiformis]|uniref:Uncharacterized protein n=1 Tax=Irpex rosettiformis TaxID=378272 RepID=A0ACB8TQ93_9APHY|nr:hypothetical protein BDY19DRAFT_605523 [Irpex rosettiformis]